uniref:Putative secretory peptide-8 n=1 Tax=Pleurobrachia bachei TaxID=34499 RepID=M4H1Q5_PLEBA|nr:putative secretory peptide-8 [Pleurobrachia bachei]|eukprot:sb/3477861/
MSPLLLLVAIAALLCPATTLPTPGATHGGDQAALPSVGIINPFWTTAHEVYSYCWVPGSAVVKIEHQVSGAAREWDCVESLKIWIPEGYKTVTYDSTINKCHLSK